MPDSLLGFGPVSCFCMKHCREMDSAAMRRLPETECCQKAGRVALFARSKATYTDGHRSAGNRSVCDDQNGRF